MPSSSLPITRAKGLNYQPNQLAVEDGSLTIAKNVIIKRDNVIEPRRGFKLYGTPMGSTSDRAKQLLQYKNRILRHFGTTLQYDTLAENALGQSVFNSFSGSYSEVQDGVRIKSVEGNGNFYFTTSDGIKKISASSANQFTTNPGFIKNAGGIKALDVETELSITLGSSTGFLPTDSTVAYRILWGNTDNNNVLVLGTPSERSVIYNPLQEMLVRDLNNTLSALDTTGELGNTLINDLNYGSTLSLSLVASASAIRTNLILLAEKLDNDINYTTTINTVSRQIVSSTIGSVVFDTSMTDYLTVGDRLLGSGFGDAEFNDNVFTVTALSTTTLTNDTIAFTVVTPFVGAPAAPVPDVGGVVNSYNYTNITQSPIPSSPATHVQLQEQADYLSNIIERLQLELSGVIPTSTAGSIIDPLDITNTANVNVTITVPEEVGLNDFYQIYRSDITTAVGTDVILDLSPNDEMKLVFEAFPTQTQLDAGIIEVLDVVPESFSQGATNLYTNEIAGEGILQANERPPVALDVASFKNATFYANTRTKERFSLFLLGVSRILEDITNGLAPKLTISDGTTTNEYSFIKGVQEISDITTVAATILNGKRFQISSANDETLYNVFYNTGITSIGIGATSTITSNAHGLSNGDSVTIIGSNSTPSVDGTFVVANTMVNTFDITPTDTVTAVGNTGRWSKDVSGETTVRVDIGSGDANTVVAEKTSSALSKFPDDFSTIVATNVVTVTNLKEGVTTNPTDIDTGFTITTVQNGNGERIASEITTLDFATLTAASFTAVGNSDSFRINAPQDRELFYVWFQTGASVDPSSVNPGRTGVQITVDVADTDTIIAGKVQVALEALDAFSATVNGSIVTATTTNFGATTNPSIVVMPGAFVLIVTQDGALNILVSGLISPSLAVDETAKSIIRVVNRNDSEIVNGFYISGANDTPGDMLFEARSLSTGDFYIMASSQGTGVSFNPEINPSLIGITNTAADPTVVSAIAHGLTDGQQVIISNSNSVPNINGVYSVSGVTANTFTIPVSVQTAGTQGSILSTNNSTVSDNEEASNRVFYSKLQQPEAVPLVNFFDVGDNSPILRIFPLRDSLFVFKEDGLYRISGEVAPFNLALFDSSSTLIASDSLGLSNNIIFCWTNQGISTVSEAGVNIISREIDTVILTLGNNLFPNFSKATWGVGYESDNSYIVYTVSERTDTEATIAFRYDTLTGAWTNFDKTNTCGLLRRADDLLYMGAGDINFIEQERKNFDRTDYADRESTRELLVDNYLADNTTLIIQNAGQLKVGQALVQTQLLSIYEYNQLLSKLDLDTGPADNDYSSTLLMLNGQDLRTKLVELANKLDADTGLNNLTSFLPAVVNTGTDSLDITSHGFLNGEAIRFSTTGTLPTGLNDTDVFYVLNASANSFQVAATKTGLAIDFVNQGTGTHSLNLYSYNEVIISRSAYSIVSNSATNPTVITSINHGLEDGRRVVIVGNAGSSPTINNIYTITKISADAFSIPVSVTTGGTGGTFTTLDQTFLDIQASYNAVITTLNSDPRVSFSNYTLVDHDTVQEAVVTSINSVLNQITISPSLPLVAGELVFFESIDSEFQYCPQTMQDPLGIKHMREATVMFQNKTFTSAVLSFASDLLPGFIDIPFNGLGNGVFGFTDFGEGFFGGNSHSAPFRTYIPRPVQRCRFLNIKFTHNIAREKYSIYGVTLTGNISQSTRAYR